MSVKDVKKSLENCMIPVSDHVLQAFKLNSDSEYVSLKKLNETIDSWTQTIAVLDEVNDEEDEDNDRSVDSAEKFDEFADDY